MVANNYLFFSVIVLGKLRLEALVLFKLNAALDCIVLTLSGCLVSVG